MPEEPARRPRLPSEERRAQLLALGVESLVDRPLESVTIDGLAAGAGVSRGLLFHYFGSKQGLRHAIVLTARDAMLHATEPDPDLPPIERLTDTTARSVEFVRSHSGTFHALVRGVSAGDTEVRALVDEARAVNAERAVAVFTELGRPDTPMLRTALRAWVAFVEEVLVEAAIPTDLPVDELTGKLVRSAIAVVDATA